MTQLFSKRIRNKLKNDKCNRYLFEEMRGRNRKPIKIMTGKNEYLNKFGENQFQNFYSFSTFNFKFVSELLT